MQNSVRTSRFPHHGALAVARAAKSLWTTVRRTSSPRVGQMGGELFESLEDRRLLSAVLLSGTGIGTPGSYNNSGNTYANALDGKLNTYFDSSQGTGAYVGLDLGTARTLSQVQVAPRSGFGWRMTGGQIQGSNDMSSWTTLGTISGTPADNTLTSVPLSGSGSFRYVRYVSPADGFGNIAEVQFFADSSTSGTTTTTVPAPNPVSVSTSGGKLSGTGFGTAGSYNNSGNTFGNAFDGNLGTYFDSSQADGAYVGIDLGSAQSLSQVKVAPRSGFGWRMTGGQIQASNDMSNWVPLSTITGSPADNTLTSIPVSGSYRYVRYVSPAGGFGNIAEFQVFGGSGSSTTGGTTSTPTPVPITVGGSGGQLTGSGFGTAGSYNNSGNTFGNALDGNLGTYFDSSQADGAYVGIDLGSSQSLSQVKVAPRAGFGWRMAGGQIQGSNDMSSWTTLSTISGSPADNTLTSIPVSGSYRYVRYVSPASGFGNIAEFQAFGGSGSSTTTTTSTPPAPVVTSNPTPTAAAPQPVLTLMENNITAGMAIQARATDTVLNSGTPVTARYEWNFGDPNGKYNTLVGFNAAHVYDTPGTYTITLKVTNEGGASATVSRQVTVNADNRRTIYVDSVNGNDNNAGTSSGAAVRSAAKAFQMLGDNTKILFARGETFPVYDFLYATFHNITIGAYGSGANPVLQWQGGTEEWREMISASAAATQDMMVENLTFTVGNSGDPVGVAPRGVNVTIRNCTFCGNSIAINCAGNPTGLLVQDNTQPANSGVHDYFLWLQGTDAVVLGNNVGPGSQYAIRTSGGTGQTEDRALFAYNTLSCDQRSNLRVQKGSYCYAANNTINTSGVEFGPLGGGDGFADPNWATARSTYDVFENNVCNLTSPHYIRLSNGTDHISVRNNFIHHDGDGEAISIEGYDPNYRRQVEDAYILNNTVTNYSAIGQMLKQVTPEASPQVTVENNLYIAPNLGIGANGAAPVYVDANDISSFRLFRDNVWSLPGTTNGWAAGGINFVGTSYAYPDYVTPTNWEAMAQVDHDTFATVQIAGNGTPASGSTAAAYSRSAPGVFTDIYGKARPTFSNWSAGAVQV